MAVTHPMFIRDLVERAVATFIQSFLAVFVVGDLGTVKVAGVAAATAALSVVKSAVASRFGDGSASAVD